MIGQIILILLIFIGCVTATIGHTMQLQEKYAEQIKLERRRNAILCEHFYVRHKWWYKAGIYFQLNYDSVMAWATTLWKK